MHNLSLIIFTLMIQTSVGVFGASIFNSWINKTEIVQIPLIILSTCLGFIALGLISATAHLGNLKHAHHAVFNIKSSWLSREIISINLFGASVVLLWILTFSGFQKGLFIIETASIILGILTVSTMGQVYRLRTVPVWNSIATPLDFFGSTLLTGGVVSGTLNLLISGKTYSPCLIFLMCSFIGLCLKI
ncbi:MAG: dimethyl sulfoxide reductase anchor subunit, partial [Desulfobacterium sp.]